RVSAPRRRHARGASRTTRTSKARGPEMDPGPQVATRAAALGSLRRRPERLPGEARRIGYLYVAPAFILDAAFNLLPLFQGINISFYNWDGITPGTWVGLDNYTEFFTDPTILAGYTHVLILMIFYAFLPIVIGLFLAALISRIRIRGLTVFRILLFLPLVITEVVTAVAWTWVYDINGPISTALRAIGLGRLVPAQGWLGDF